MLAPVGHQHQSNLFPVGSQHKTGRREPLARNEAGFWGLRGVEKGCRNFLLTRGGFNIYAESVGLGGAGHAVPLDIALRQS
jgi:hypothetical protein